MHNKPIILSIILLVAVLASACNTNPTISSSGTPPASTPSSSPAPSTSPGAPSGTSPGTSSAEASSVPAGSTPAGKTSQKPAGTPAGQDSAAASGTQKSTDQAGQTGEKTDAQILAEALDELGKKNTLDKHDENQGTGQTPAMDSEKGSAAATDAEKTAELDRRLGDQFARFDDLILAEREVTGMHMGEFRIVAAHSYKLPSHSVTTKPPADVGAGQDDDIIARQLREAAMKERDPELRAKLWDEYRKYKKSS